MPREFTRPPTDFSFNFGGMKLNTRPDLLPAGKYALAVNARSYSQGEIRTRPGLAQLFDCGVTASNSTAVDLRAYTTLGTGDLPRILLRDATDAIYLDNGVMVGSMVITTALGASLIPFRPNASPQPWMYIANGADYQKYSSPTLPAVGTSFGITNAFSFIGSPMQWNSPTVPPVGAIIELTGGTNPLFDVVYTVLTASPTTGAFTTNQPLGVPNTSTTTGGTLQIIGYTTTALGTVVLQQKVGIAEPQSEPLPALVANLESVIYQSHGTPAFVSAGNAGATSSGARISDTCIASFPDPAGVSNQSLQVGASVAYSRFMMIKVGTSLLQVLDVFPTVGTAIAINAIYYFTGTTGHCMIVPNTLSSGLDENQSIYGTTQLSSLRRGALIQVGSEVCLVWSVTFGPNNSISIETSTVSNHTISDTITGVATVVVEPDVTGSMAGLSITSADDTFTVTGAGIGTITATISPNPFVVSGASYQDNDYIHVSVLVDNLANLVEAKFLLDIGDGSFTQNFFYYTIRPADITAAILNTATQLATAQTTAQNQIIDELNAIQMDDQNQQTWAGDQTASGASQWAEILIPINELTRVGSDQTRSLQTLTKLQLLFNTSATINCAVNGIYITGGGQPDVGDVGAPMQYRYRGRSSVTGAVSNPSPASRYGVNPRRRQVNVTIPNGTSPYDPQIDTWDIFRFGGSVTEWRFAGSIPTSTNLFVDNYDDAALQAGDALDFDNFEPWPSVGLPLLQMPLSGGAGTEILVNTIGINVVRIIPILPGTLVQFPGSGNNNVYTLRTRPVQIDGQTWRFDFLESVGVPSGSMTIYEPLIANQKLPYMWGPDVNGTVFAVGDPLRPGTLYFAKGNNPDSASDSYNIEIVPPTEPLQGGEVLDGLSFVASTKRWWALYPQPGNPTQRYNFVQQPVPRGLAAPWGHCNDGVSIFFWASDGIYSTTHESLTDADLYNLFPHEGVDPQQVSYNGITILPPDYAQAAKFRLTYCNGYLYATYPYINGGGAYAPVLVLDLRTKAWSVDVYQNTVVTNLYAIEQTPESANVRNPVLLLAGTQSLATQATRVFEQSDLSNDNPAIASGNPNGAIPVTIATSEFNGGDFRAPKQWGDLFMDCAPQSPLSVTPVSLGVPVAPRVIIPLSPQRVRTPVSVGGIVVSDFLGAFIQWTDDFTAHQEATTIYAWQPSFVVQPARDISWSTFGSAFGLKGYLHAKQITLAYVATVPLILTTVTYDGQNPVPITMPSTGGAYQKVTFQFSANKGLLFQFNATSAAQFQIFNDDCELYIGEWGRQDNYAVIRGFGGRVDDDAPI